MSINKRRELDYPKEGGEDEIYEYEETLHKIIAADTTKFFRFNGS